MRGLAGGAACYVWRMVNYGAEAGGFLDAGADAVKRGGNGFMRLIFQDENADGGFAGAVEAGAYADSLDGGVFISSAACFSLIWRAFSMALAGIAVGWAAADSACELRGLLLA